MGDTQTTKAAETARVKQKTEDRPPHEHEYAPSAFAEATLFRAAASDDPTTPPQHMARVLRRLASPHQTGFLLQCQRRYGNAYVQRMVSARDNGHSSPLEPEAYTQEEPIARQVTALQSGTAPDVATAYAEEASSLGGPENIAVQTEPQAVLITPNVQRQKGKDDEEDNPILTKSAGSMADSFEPGADVETQVSLSKGRGSPLPEPVRAYMEPRFGVDFNQVRVHTGSNAIHMNQAVGAQAFTVGRDIAPVRSESALNFLSARDVPGKSVMQCLQRESKPSTALKTRGALPAATRPAPASGAWASIQRAPSCACGGYCPRCQAKKVIQAKLAISAPADPYEQEADRVTEQVTRMPVPTVQRTCATCAAGGTTCPTCGLLARQGRGVTGNPQLDAVLGGGYALAQGALGAFAADPASGIRLGLEFARLGIGPVGLVAGLGSDLIGAGQDLMAVPAGNEAVWWFAEGGIVVRSALNIVVNAIGQVAGVNDLIQDVLGATTAVATLSGLGLPVDAVTVPLLGVTVAVNKGASGLKAELTMALGGLDLLVAMGAGVMALIGPKDDTEEWAELVAGYTANVIGDAVSFVIEIAGFFTPVGSQSGILGIAFESLEQFVKLVVKLTGGFVKLIQAIWNVLGGKAITNPFGGDKDEGLDPLPVPPITSPFEGFEARGSGSLPGPPLARAVSDGGGWSALVAELEAVQACVQEGDGRIGDVGAALADLIAEAVSGAEAVTGAVDPIGAITAAMNDAFAELEGRLEMIGGVEGAIADASERLISGQQGVEAAVATIEAIEFPHIDLPVGGDVVDAMISPIRDLFDQAKQAVLAPVEGVRGQLAELAELAVALQESARMQRETIEAVIGDLRAAVEASDGLPDLLRSFLDELVRGSTLGEEVGWDGLVASWQEIGPMVEGALEQARARAAAPGG